MTLSSRLKVLLSVAAGLFVLAVVFMLLQGQEQSGSTPGAKSDLHQVQTMKVQVRDIDQTLTLPANISPWYQATLYGKVSGYVKWIGVDKGDVVKQGQLLATMDAPEIEDQFEQAEADYTIKKVTYERYLGVWQENHDIIAKQDVDVAKAAAESAKHLRDSRRTLLGYTKVYAPFSGVITARFADPGALIQAATGSSTGAVPLFTIMDMEKVRIYVNVPQEAAYFAKPGLAVTLVSRELPGREVAASITRTTEALDPATRTLLVEIDVPNTDRRFQPGMFINASLHLQRHPQTLAVSPGAIVPDKTGQRKSVFVVEGGTAKLRQIKTGIDDGIWMEVLEGLSGDEEVVVVGKGDLADGRAVHASPYNLPAGTPAKQKL
ncbi:putative Membrane-fusion protein of multidrug efflux transporter [Nitrospira sp. KM1]|uniref:efflux RND transporter periplasmic adaptor subunit n=1 Tax=Nitrospira sp. KM1 TaxID=1936990 RepID=UPI0013A7B57D|nr:efflux RND transporter periplasmic adaptor subunit [Nitrospira sp. KM1]BCA56166.1 putative Membrane-fusion protein of multidrug efflux transporter [Nitrospira sp. KM1]